MMEDRDLLAKLRALPPPPPEADGGGGGASRRLRIYISLQPCHHSSSTIKISCTRDLFRFHESELLPRRVALELVVAYPYRSHWEPGAPAVTRVRTHRPLPARSFLTYGQPARSCDGVGPERRRLRAPC